MHTHKCLVCKHTHTHKHTQRVWKQEWDSARSKVTTTIRDICKSTRIVWGLHFMSHIKGSSCVQHTPCHLPGACGFHSCCHCWMHPSEILCHGGAELVRAARNRVEPNLTRVEVHTLVLWAVQANAATSDPSEQEKGKQVMWGELPSFQFFISHLLLFLDRSLHTSATGLADRVQQKSGVMPQFHMW